MGDELSVRTRAGHDITSALSEPVSLPAALAARSTVLDGELVAGRGRAFDFYRLGPRLTSGTPPGRVRTPIAFVAFALPYFDGELASTRWRSLGLSCQDSVALAAGHTRT